MHPLRVYKDEFDSYYDLLKASVMENPWRRRQWERITRTARLPRT